MCKDNTMAHGAVVAWLNQVRQLQAAVIATHPDGGDLQQRFAEVQHQAQQQILGLSPVASPRSEAFSPVAFQTEISRTLRLVAIDIQFLAMARQSVKRQARQAQLRDRLTQLLNQGQGLLQTLPGGPED
ncbi:MAG: heterocyst frequency control protein PatD [Cyanobacteria bacterium]|nr:heterocyst frequency control protein PatD [Cyanobacteriota bacterium]MDA0866828.1 heterocyst frequency control protein PatD [Cyanobacteriota bacterium]